MKKIADMHCHIVPGVDDGARTLKESLDILKEEYAQGVRLLITTPHWRRGMFETDRDIVEQQFLKLQSAAKENFPDLELYPGCEFHIHSDMMDEICSDGRFRMNGSDYVLTEFSAHHSKAEIRDAVYSELSSGFIPIIAHIERYPACIRDPDFIGELKNMGALVQVNADSAAGRDGWGVKRAVLRLIGQGLVDFIGSDAHNTGDRACHLLECEKVIRKKFGEATARELMWEHPYRLTKEAGRHETDDPQANRKSEPEEEKPKHRPVVIRGDL